MLMPFSVSENAFSDDALSLCGTILRMAILWSWFCASILVGFCLTGFSQEIRKLDPALDKIVGSDSKLERVAMGFNKWTEGPVWTRDGRLLFAEIPANNIVQWIPGKGAREESSAAGASAKKILRERHGVEVLAYVK